MRNQSRRVGYNQTVADVGDEETETDRVVACLVTLMERLCLDLYLDRLPGVAPVRLPNERVLSVNAMGSGQSGSKIMRSISGINFDYASGGPNFVKAHTA